VVSVLGSFNCFAKLTGEATDNIPEKICNTEIETDHRGLGKVEIGSNSSSQKTPQKPGEKSKNEMEIAEKTTKKTSW